MPLSLGTAHPDLCPECGGYLTLRYGQHGYYYSCEFFPECHGNASAQPDGSPMGRAAVLRIRKARTTVHQLLDALQRKKIISRTQIYDWLNEVFKCPNAHISNLGLDELRFLIREIQKNFE